MSSTTSPQRSATQAHVDPSECGRVGPLTDNGQTTDRLTGVSSMRLSTHERSRAGYCSRETNGLQEQESKLFHGAEHAGVFADQLAMLDELVRREPQPGDLPAAFWTAEQSCTRVFLELIGQARRHAIAGIPPKVQDPAGEGISCLC